MKQARTVFSSLGGFVGRALDRGVGSGVTLADFNGQTVLEPHSFAVTWFQLGLSSFFKHRDLTGSFSSAVLEPENRRTGHRYSFSRTRRK